MYTGFVLFFVKFENCFFWFVWGSLLAQFCLALGSRRSALGFSAFGFITTREHGSWRRIGGAKFSPIFLQKTLPCQLTKFYLNPICLSAKTFTGLRLVSISFLIQIWNLSLCPLWLSLLLLNLSQIDDLSSLNLFLVACLYKQFVFP